MTKVLAAILFGCLSAQLAHASDIIGNGGDVVNCPDSVEMLDLYEGRTVRGLVFDTSLLGVDELATVQNILNRLEPVDPVRVRNFRAWAATFMSEARLVPNADLTDISDSNHLAVPTDCKIEQLVIQAEPKFDQDPRYLISEKLWLRMDNASRASMILHELFYREAISAGHVNSIASRYLNSLFSSTGFPGLSKQALLSAIEKAEFPFLVFLSGSFFQQKQVYLYWKRPRNGSYSCSAQGLRDVVIDSRVDLEVDGTQIPVGFQDFFTSWMPSVNRLVLDLRTQLDPDYAHYYRDFLVTTSSIDYFDGSQENHPNLDLPSLCMEL